MEDPPLNIHKNRLGARYRSCAPILLGPSDADVRVDLAANDIAQVVVRGARQLRQVFKGQNRGRSPASHGSHDFERAVDRRRVCAVLSRFAAVEVRRWKVHLPLVVVPRRVRRTATQDSVGSKASVWPRGCVGLCSGMRVAAPREDGEPSPLADGVSAGDTKRASQPPHLRLRG